MAVRTGAAGAGETESIVDELRRAVEGDAWHGPSLDEVLDGVTAERARARPIPGAHTIGELVLHMASWTAEAARRLRTGLTDRPEAGDWPRFDGSEAAWDGARRRLDDAHRELLAAVAAFPAARLHEPLDGDRTYADLLHGLAQHHAYHGGQITLLRRALGA